MQNKSDKSLNINLAINKNKSNYTKGQFRRGIE